MKKLVVLMIFAVPSHSFGAEKIWTVEIEIEVLEGKAAPSGIWTVD